MHFSRHAVVQDWLFKLAEAALVHPRKEMSLPGSQLRPGDVFIESFTDGKDTAIDVTVVSPIQATLINNSSNVRMFAANKAAEEKKSKYHELCSQQGTIFVPFALENFGGLHCISLHITKKLFALIHSRTSDPIWLISKTKLEYLSFRLQRAIANSIIKRIPEYNATES